MCVFFDSIDDWKLVIILSELCTERSDMHRYVFFKRQSSGRFYFIFLVFVLQTLSYQIGKSTFRKVKTHKWD